MVAASSASEPPHEELAGEPRSHDLSAAAFVGSLAQELESRIGGLRAALELVGDATTPAETRACLDAAREAAERTSELVTSAAAWSEIACGKVAFAASEFSLREMVRSALQSVTPRLLERRIEVVRDVAADVPDLVVGDARRLRQSLQRLLERAASSIEQGEVALEVVAQRSDTADAAGAAAVTLRFTLRDSGLPLRDDEREILRHAARGLSLLPRQPGAIGLAVASGLLVSMGARFELDADSATDDSALTRIAFALTLPLVAEPLDEVDAPLAGLRVLVIEPNARARRAADHALTRLRCVARVAASRTEALELLSRGEEADVVLIEDDGRLASEDPLAFRRREVGPPADPPPRRWPRPIVHVRRFNARVSGSGGVAVGKPICEHELASALAVAIEWQILVAELDERALTSVAEELARRGGSIVRAATIDAALHALKTQPIDAIVAVVSRPERGAVELALRVRELEAAHARPRLPLAIVADLLIPGDRDLCAQFGADACLAAGEPLATLFACVENPAAP